jgi:hypothetical protein
MIRRSLKKIIQWIMEQESESELRELRLGSVRDIDKNAISRHSNNHISFNMYTANGGHVIECTTINRTTERHVSALYIIPESENFEKNLGEIITIERLKICH